jgi:hypothetical protein
VLVAIGCENNDNSLTEGSPTPTGGGGGSGKAGFSADLAKSMNGSGGSGGGSSEKPAPDAKGSGSDAKPATDSGSDTKVAMTGSDPKPATSGSDVKPAAGSGSDTKVASAGSGSAKSPTPTAGSSTEGSVAAAGSNVAKTSPPIADPTGPRVYIKPSAELASIKVSLLPNWKRDVGEAGTISLAVEIPGTNDSKIFVFHYGLEAASAPKERDKYIAWLHDQKLFERKTDRQRGGSWMIEGDDASGVPSFRFALRFGDRWVICGGPQYKDAASSKLGDLRDQTVLQAKQICENVTL